MSGRLTGDPGCYIFTDSYSLSSPSSVFVQPANDGCLKVIACCGAACPIGATVFVVQAAADCVTELDCLLSPASRQPHTCGHIKVFAMHEACKLSLGACML